MADDFLKGPKFDVDWTAMEEALLLSSTEQLIQLIDRMAMEKAFTDFGVHKGDKSEMAGGFRGDGPCGRS